LIKYHHDPIIFPIQAEIFVSSLSINSTNLDFEKLLIRRFRSIVIDLSSTSEIPTFWRLKNIQELSSIFSFTATEGLINHINVFLWQSRILLLNPSIRIKQYLLKCWIKIKQEHLHPF
jgi:hypothetical protein